MKRNNRRRLDTCIWTTNAILLLIGIYVAWPHWSAHQLRNAVEERDVAALSRKIEWPSLRASIKEAIGSLMIQQMAATPPSTEPAANAITAGLVTMLGPAMINGVVDAHVTPQGIAALLGTNAEAKKSLAEKLGPGGIKRSGLVSLTRFEVEVGKPDEASGEILIVLELTGFDWKLTQLVPLKPLAAPFAVSAK